MQMLPAVLVHLLLAAGVTTSADTPPACGLLRYNYAPPTIQLATVNVSSLNPPLSAFLSPLPLCLALDGGSSAPSSPTSAALPTINELQLSAALRELGGCLVSSPTNPLLLAMQSSKRLERPFSQHRHYHLPIKLHA
nr:uncharacterized protein LOC129388136 [Dermacentor andersoni]